MSENGPFTIEPWCLRETSFQEAYLGQSESLFALSNGLIGMRGNLDEGEPNVLPGTYLNSVYERRHLPHAESAYGYPESSETIINVTDGKFFRLLVEDEPFDIRYGEVREHERVLDMRDGVLRRKTEWVSPAGQAVRVTSTRLVSLSQRSIAAVEYCVEALDKPLRIVVQSELVANELAGGASNDPRVAAVIESPLVSEDQYLNGTRLGLVHQTKRSGLRVATCMDHVIDAPEHVTVSSDITPDTGRLTITTTIEPGEKLRITKFIGYGWSAHRSLPALRDQVHAAVSMATNIGWETLCREQTEYLDAYWDRADVEIEGDPEIQQAIRFSLFHMLQASARAERRGVPAKGLTGPGYDGHVFWDMETFLLQALVFTDPEAAADAIRWRHSILPSARERAAQLGLDGAAFPWRTISGGECSGYWPAGTAQFHINADIADATMRYLEVTEDEEFERTIGIDILVETARLWMSLGQHDVTGKFRIDGVTGPDEYTAIVDNNVFTNLMAQRNLRSAAYVAERHPDRSAELGVSNEDLVAWRKAADNMMIPYDEVLNVHPQSEGFTRHEQWDFKNTRHDQYPLLLNFHYFEIYRKQVLKQADLVLAIQMCPDAFTYDEKVRNFEYYEKLTTRDSSLSAATQSVVAAEVGFLDLAYDYLAEAALVDLRDVHGNARDGLHMASMAGTWMSIVMGFGGMRLRPTGLSFQPRLPRGITRLAFTVTMLGRRLRVEVTPEKATYTLRDNDGPLEVVHDDETVSLTADEPSVCAVPPYVTKPAPPLPFGRTPVSRRSYLVGIEQEPVAPSMELPYNPLEQ